MLRKLEKQTGILLGLRPGSTETTPWSPALAPAWLHMMFLSPLSECLGFRVARPIATHVSNPGGVLRVSSPMASATKSPRHKTEGVTAKGVGDNIIPSWPPILTHFCPQLRQDLVHASQKRMLLGWCLRYFAHVDCTGSAPLLLLPFIFEQHGLRCITANRLYYPLLYCPLPTLTPSLYWDSLTD
jgi:hypothetical protein